MSDPSAVVPREPARARPRPARVVLRRVVAALAALAALAIAAAGGLYALARHYDGQIHRITLTQLHKSGKAQNFLLVGSDTRAGVGRGFGSGAAIAGQRADTIIVAHMPARNEKPTLVSIPRDTYVEIPAYDDSAGRHHPAHAGKINSAFEIGGAQGRQLLIDTVSRLTRLPISHYVEVNFAGFKRMVDALGGVTLCARTSRHDPATGPNGGSNDFMTAGTHHDVNGATALAFVRDRHSFPDQDVSRIRDEQYFLAQMLKKVLSTGTLANPLKMNAFLNAATTAMTVDRGMTLRDLRGLATRLRHTDPRHVAFVTLPYRTSDGSAVIDGVRQSVVLPDPQRDSALFRQLLGGSSDTGRAEAAPLPVRVVNGSGTAGLAHRVAAALRARGLHAVVGGNAPAAAATTVAAPAAGRAEAESVAAALIPAPRVTAAAGGAVTVVLGGDFTAVSAATLMAPPAAALAEERSASQLTCGA